MDLAESAGTYRGETRHWKLESRALTFCEVSRLPGQDSGVRILTGSGRLVVPHGWTGNDPTLWMRLSAEEATLRRFVGTKRSNALSDFALERLRVIAKVAKRIGEGRCC